MKLFQKTLILFAAIIVFQSLLTIIFITRTISQSQAVDAEQELTAEASSVYNNFNSWKLSFWEKINQLYEDENIKDLISAAGGVAFDDRLISLIQRSVSGSGAEFAIIKKGRSTYFDIIPIFDTTIPVPGIENFSYAREHPYIEIVQWQNTLYFTGCVRLSGREKNAPYIDVFILKQIDHKLLENLSSNQHIKVLLSTGGNFSLGPFSDEKLAGRIYAKLIDRSYTAMGRIDIKGEAYSAVFRSTGSVQKGHETETLNLSVFLSLADYQKQLRDIKRAVLSISLVSAAVTILLSLFFSGNITSPIRRLLAALHVVKEGEYNIEVSASMKGEIGELLSGFNDMAHQLSIDKAALDRQILEIIRLKEYNEKIINAIREGIVVINDRLIVEKTNQAFLELFGL
ncbi:MAG: HAMP domain-containing protein, partial [Spirochaetales bacterium]